MIDDPRDESSEFDRTIASDNDHATVGSGTRNPSGWKQPVIPGYKVLGELGAGGMGVVWEAEQQNPRRRVALKVIRGGSFVDEAQVRMFQREADTLARLKHPDIGGIYEAGRTNDGQHFFAMELVRGKTLGEYLNARLPSWELTAEEVRFRVQLFQRIASAVHYAHQRGVIHRDLKPSNIIVGDIDDTGTNRSDKSDAAARLDVKVLDFGLARIIDPDVQASMISEVGIIKGTLAYMSPEQARGNPDDVDVRTDVYSLGVILYEMLSGRSPRQMPSASMLEALKVVTEHRPRPLRENFRGPRRLDADVATICHKALELDPEDRYDGAAALVDDLGRWLSNQPIQARPPTAAYQLRKLVVRNKATSAFVATVLFLLVGLAVTMSVLRGVAEESRRQAQAAVERLEVARTELETVADFQARMLSDLNVETIGRHLFESLRSRLNTALEGDPNRQAALANFGDRLKLVNPTDIALGVLEEDILTRAEKAVEDEFAEQPEVRGRLEHSLGRTALRLGLYDRGEAMLQRAVATFEEIGAESNNIAVRSDLASLAIFVGDWDKAARELERAHVDGQRLVGLEHPDMIPVYSNEALLYREQNNWVVAESLYTELVVLCTRLHGADAEETLIAREGRAYTWSYLDRLEEAEAEYAAILPVALRLWGSDHAMMLTFEHNAAQNYVRMERYDEALQIYKRGLEAARRIQGSDHSETLVAVVNLGRLYARIGRYQEAEAQGREALDIATRTVAPQSLDMAMACAVLGEGLQGQGRHAEAESYLKRAYDIFATLFGPASGGARTMALMIVTGMESRGTLADIELWRQRADPETDGPQS